MIQSMKVVELNQEPTELEVLCGMISGSAESDFVGATRTLTLRMPMIMYATIKAMADNSNGQSMNTICTHLFRVALDQVQTAIDGETAAKIDLIRQKILSEEVTR